MIRHPIIFPVVLLLAAFLCGHSAAQELLQPLQKLSLQTTDLAATRPAATNAPKWESSVTLGFTMTKGNSDTLLVMGNIQTKRRSNANEWLFGAGGSYGENNSVKNYDMLRGFGQFNHFYTSRLYIFGRVDGLHDGIKDIQYRATASTGLGYYLMQRTNLSFIVEASPSLVAEEQGNQTDNYTALRLAERFDWRLNSAARIWQLAELIPQTDQPSNFIVNLEVGIETPITKELSLRVLIQDSYVNEPAFTYQNNDIRLVSGLSVRF